MELLGVRVEIPANTPMVLLQEQGGEHRLLPIMIGTAEAAAIHHALEGVEPPRPLTHDLFVIMLQTLGATVDKVVVTDLRDHTFYAELHVTTAEGPKVVSCRPSDAIALAVRVDAPLFASEALLDEAGQAPPPEPEDEAEEIIDEFKDFLDTVNPDDFV
jgi:bifunctional DNase/RNase